MDKTPLIVITGPTATGKTETGAALCRILNGEVISADSMQVYRGMDIGTAKPTPEERQGVPHHMIDVAGPEEPYSVDRWTRAASRAVSSRLLCLHAGQIVLDCAPDAVTDADLARIYGSAESEAAP